MIDVGRLYETPRVKAVWEADQQLGYGSIVEVPEDHPPCDPWELAVQLERELISHMSHMCQAIENANELKKCVDKMRKRLL